MAYISACGALMLLRLFSLVAGICSPYLAVIPFLSGFPRLRPLWLEFLLGVSAVCLLAVASPSLEKRSHFLALLGSGLVIFLYSYSWVISYLARRGRVHFEARIFAKPETWFDRWRILLDRPISNLLLFCSVLCFLLALCRWSQVRLQGAGSSASAAGQTLG